MDEYYEYDQQFQKKKQFEEKANENFAKSQLKKKIKCSIETGSIGALATFEELFGEIFGHGKKYEELSEDQRDWRETWLDAREEILRRCANGVRLSIQEIDRCDIKNYNNKKYNTIIKNKERNDG